MIFSSYEFTFLFLPITLAVYFFVSKQVPDRYAIGILVIASIVFYAWWNPSLTWLIVVSIIFNFLVGSSLSDSRINNKLKKNLLIFGILCNILLLSYFKYLNFFYETAYSILGISIEHYKISLPLAISFFTFQQIAFIVDSYQGIVRERNFLSYCLFVTFFPQLIAGPILHHKEMMPQFKRKIGERLSSRNLAIGLSIFAVGLFKKLLIADNLADISDGVYAVAALNDVTFLEAWLGALAYTGQIYFDFSAYSDMALGLARLFGIRLPANFLSPYKATSIIDFWRRWHITLSRFLRDYVYIPLGGNRMGPARRHINIMVTMLLGGLWHGAGWTFVAWGALHGMYILVNHAWRDVTLRYGLFRNTAAAPYLIFMRALTFVSVVIAWVLFRAPTFADAKNMLSGMAGLNGIVLPGGVGGLLGPLAEKMEAVGVGFGNPGKFTSQDAAVVLLSLLITWMLPNVYEVMRAYNPILDSHRLATAEGLARLMKWRPSLSWAAAIGCVFVLAALSMGQTKEFLYFDF